MDQAILRLSNTIEMINTLNPKDFDAEFTAEQHLRFGSARVLAHFLRQNLDAPMYGPEEFDAGEKLFWAEVAIELGSDWINKFRRVGALMAAVDKA